MDQQYICTIFCPFLPETVQPQACDDVYIYSVLNPGITYVIEIVYTYALPVIKGLMRRFIQY